MIFLDFRGTNVSAIFFGTHSISAETENVSVYHKLGKCYLPPCYNFWQNSFWLSLLRRFPLRIPSSYFWRCGRPADSTCHTDKRPCYNRSSPRQTFEFPRISSEKCAEECQKGQTFACSRSNNRSKFSRGECWKTRLSPEPWFCKCKDFAILANSISNQKDLITVEEIASYADIQYIVLVKAFNWKHLNESVRLKAFEWKRSIESLQLKAFNWQRSIESVRLKAFNWKCSIESVWLKAFDWKRSIESIPLKVFHWKRSIKSVWVLLSLIKSVWVQSKAFEYNRKRSIYIGYPHNWQFLPLCIESSEIRTTWL